VDGRVLLAQRPPRQIHAGLLGSFRAARLEAGGNTPKPRAESAKLQEETGHRHLGIGALPADLPSTTSYDDFNLLMPLFAPAGKWEWHTAGRARRTDPEMVVPNAPKGPIPCRPPTST